MEDLYAEIARKIKQGALNRSKVSVFHTEVLLNADKLMGVDAKDFCRRVGMGESFSVEFHKIMNVASTLQERGYYINKDSESENLGTNINDDVTRYTQDTASAPSIIKNTFIKNTLAEVLRQFGLTLNDENNLFAVVNPVTPSDTLQAALGENVPLALAINSEKARSELIIMPLLLEVRRRTQASVSVFSGVSFDVDEERGLNGYCDYLLSRSPQQYFVEAPVLTVVEAKNEDIKGGFGQCIATVVAAQIFNERQGQGIRPVYGAVTTGEVWRFLRLEGATVLLDHEERYLRPVENLLGVLFATVS